MGFATIKFFAIQIQTIDSFLSPFSFLSKKKKASHTKRTQVVTNSLSGWNFYRSPPPKHLPGLTYLSALLETSVCAENVPIFSPIVLMFQSTCSFLRNASFGYNPPNFDQVKKPQRNPLGLMNGNNEMEDGTMPSTEKRQPSFALY